MRQIDIVSALSALMFGCGSDAQDDGSDVFDDVAADLSGELIDNGDGTVALPESWEFVEVPQSSATVVDKSTESTEVRAGVGPSLYSKNVTYTLTLPYGGGASGSVFSIPYTWSLGYIPAGLSVFLCRSTTANCATITGSQSGTVHNFDLSPSNVPFIFAFKVTGAGTLTPFVQGKSDQAIVNFN